MSHKLIRLSNVKLLNQFNFSLNTNFQSRNYAKKPTGLSKGSPSVLQKKSKLQPVLDPELLTTRLCGGNILEKGEDPILKADSEYPDWLWKLKIDAKPISLEKVDKNTWEFWNRVHKMDKKRRSQEMALKHKYHKF